MNPLICTSTGLIAQDGGRDGSKQKLGNPLKNIRKGLPNDKKSIKYTFSWRQHVRT